MAKVKIDESVQVQEVVVAAPTEKENLLALYDTLKALGIRSISDLENLIAKAE